MQHINIEKVTLRLLRCFGSAKAFLDVNYFGHPSIFTTHTNTHTHIC